MLVYNLSDRAIEYKGKLIPANGGSRDYPSLTFVPDRDRSNKFLSFGSLPKGWKPPKPAKEPAPKATTAVAVVKMAVTETITNSDRIAVLPEVKEETSKSWKKNK
jgi:hypothetical protein